jgi:GNAT superfamily N-acetyltransferase
MSAIASTEAPTVECRPALREEFDSVARFLPELGGSAFADRFPGRTVEDFYRWKYLENPFGEAFVAAAFAGPRVVSSAAAIPKRFRIRGESVLAYELGDFLTANDFRRRGLFKKLVVLAVERAAQAGAAFVYSRPNDSSFPILSSLGFDEWRQIDERSHLVWGAALARKTRLPLAFLDRIAERAHLPESRLPAQRIERFVGGWNELFGPRTFGLAIDRGAEYLNWRYADSTAPYRLWAVEGRGYAVSLYTERESIGYLVDVSCAPDDAETAAALCSAALRDLRRSGARRIYTWTLRTAPQTAADRRLRELCPSPEPVALHLAVKPLSRADWFAQPVAPAHLVMGDFDGV